MRKLIAVAVVALSLSSAGCSKDSEINDFIKENDAFAADIKAKADKDGAEAAQKLFDSKKDDFKKKYDAIKTARGFQVKKETTEKLTTSVTNSTMSICLLTIKGDKFKKLCDDYKDLLTQ